MGGGTMRTIGRVVGAGYLRGSPVIPLPEQASGARKVSRSSSSSVASNGDSEKMKFVISSRGNTEVPVAHKSVCEIDDWEFAEGDLFEPDAPPRRVVFGPPPTREEATEATADLRQTLQKMYFSSPNISGNSALSTVVESNASEIFATNEAKPTFGAANDHAVINPMMHNNVLQAFSLLNERADVQNMVASLASDQHIWEAVMKNEKVLDFCQSNNACFLPEASAETVPVDECLGSDFAGQNGFWCFVNGMKLKMTEFIGKVSEVALSFTGLEPKKSSKDGKFGNNDFVETAVRASLMLAVVVMFVVILKRVP